MSDENTIGTSGPCMCERLANAEAARDDAREQASDFAMQLVAALEELRGCAGKGKQVVALPFGESAEMPRRDNDESALAAARAENERLRKQIPTLESANMGEFMGKPFTHWLALDELAARNMMDHGAMIQEIVTLRLKLSALRASREDEGRVERANGGRMVARADPRAAERRDAMSERERPACVGDDHQCRNVTDGHLVRVERKRSVGWICHYWQSVLRKGGPCMMPIRCAACLREWPGKETP